VLITELFFTVTADMNRRSLHFIYRFMALNADCRWSSKQTKGGISSPGCETWNSFLQTSWKLRVFKKQLNKAIKESLNCTILITLMWYS